MKIRALLAERLVVGGLVAAGALLAVAASSASAQGPTRPAARWDAWLGCWEPARTPVGVTTPLMCAVPASGYSAVDILTVSGGKVTAREHIDANGERVPDTRDGCTGWQSAQWSADGERVYLHADYTCENGVRRASTSLIAMSADGDWMEVQGLQAGKKGGVRVLMYKEAHHPGPLPPEVANAVGDRLMAVEAGRVAASAPIDAAAIAEASRRLDAPVVQAWLVNRGGTTTVSADELVRLANAGVPGSVTDVLVALANPDKFTLQAGAPPSQGEYAQAPSPTALAGTVDTTASQRPCPYSAYAWDYYGRCAYSPYAYVPWGYGPTWGSYYDPFNYYGYNSYYGNGYGGYYGGGYGGWYPYGYGQPIVIVTKTGPSNPSGHGRLVRGRGYVGGASSGGASGRTGGASAPAANAQGSSSSGSSSSGASAGRTAHRTGGGGGHR